jgi:hypothetical protein
MVVENYIAYLQIIYKLYSRWAGDADVALQDDYIEVNSTTSYMNITVVLLLG